MNDVQSSGFPNAQILTSAQKHRICIATFDNKRDAEAYLSRVRKQYPEYSGATLLSVRNIRL